MQAGRRTGVGENGRQDGVGKTSRLRWATEPAVSIWIRSHEHHTGPRPEAPHQEAAHTTVPDLTTTHPDPKSGLPTGGRPHTRPARRSLAFRPAWSLSRPGRPFSPKCFSPCRYLHEPLWPLPAEATVAGWGSHPPGKRAFPRRTVNFPLHGGNSALQGCMACYDALRTRGGGRRNSRRGFRP